MILDLQPGDCVIFHMRTVHGAAGNSSVSHQRRVLATRWLGKAFASCSISYSLTWNVSGPWCHFYSRL